MTLTFEEAKAALTKLGAEFYVADEYRGTPGVDRQSYPPLPLFTSVKIPLEPVEWVQLTRNDGAHYIGGCCSSSSWMQDMVCGWYRFADAGVKVRELEQLAAAQVEHDGEESPFFEIKDLYATIMKRESWERPDGKIIDPWWMIAAIWHLTKDHYSKEAPHAYGDHLSPVEKTLRIVERSCRAISWSRIFGNGPISQATPASQKKVDRALLLARFMPALKLLSQHAEELYYGPVEGFALIDSEEGTKAIAENGYGYCIYETRGEIDALFDSWEKENALYQEERKPAPKRDRFTIRPVRVDLNGILFTDTNELYEGKNT